MARPGDAGGIAAIYRPIVTDTVISFETDPPTETEVGRRVEANLAVAPWLVATGQHDDQVLGYAYACRHRDRAAYRWSVDVSVYVDEKSRRSGLGRGLYTKLFALLRLQGFFAAHAGITLPNAGSVGLHESLGFVPVGVYRSVGYKLGAWRDVGWWQLALSDRALAPSPPLSPGEAAGKPEWARVLADETS